MSADTVEDLLFFKLKDLITEQSEGEWTDAMVVKDAHHFASQLRPMLAASPPVGGDSFLGHLVVPKSGVGAVFIDKGQPIPLMGDKGRVVPIYEGPQSVVAPPPPSVSTGKDVVFTPEHKARAFALILGADDQGSRPQEAVPGEQADGAVVATLTTLLDNLVIAQGLSREYRQHATDEARSYLYNLRHQPADGCSSNEGKAHDQA